MTQELLQSGLQKAFGWASILLPEKTALKARELFLTPPEIVAPKAELDFLQTCEMKVEREGCPLWGWGQGKKRALLVHGWAGRGAQLRQLVRPLVENGYQTWVTDFPGHGQSPRELTHMGKFMAHITNIANSWGGIDLAVGHSLGGAALFAAAADGVRIDKLFLIGAPTDIDRVFQSFCRRWHMGKRSKARFYQLVEEMVGRRPQEVSAISIHDRVKSKVWLAHDLEDDQVPRVHPENLVQLRPDFRLISIPNVGHFRILKSKITIGALKEFANL